jgi:glycosyltransferase Alg8
MLALTSAGRTQLHVAQNRWLWNPFLMAEASATGGVAAGGGAEAFDAAAGWTLYLGGMLLLAWLAAGFDAGAELAVAVGAIGAWRYGWSAMHLLRAAVYLRLAFPRLRRAADAVGPATMPCEAFLIVTSYREDARRTVPVFAAAFRAAAGAGVPVTVVALLTDEADQHLVETVAAQVGLGARVRLVTMVQDGTGKRAALAEGLRAVARRRPAPDAVVLLVDGDTLLPGNLLARALPFFALLPRLGALTVDARPLVGGSSWAADWYALRAAQRHLLMASMSLSRRLLVLTGRMSAFRAGIAVDPAFIAQVESDHVEHWRHGRFRLLTGDDKSTWLRVLAGGWDMLYVPDLAVRSLETLPPGRFLGQSRALMARWFGNMLRANGRALALGPRRLGVFTWWCLVDQRLSMWTSLSGPAFVLAWTALVSAAALPAYLLWVATSRLAHCLLLGAVRGRIGPRMPLLLYYTQVVGALMKLHVAFRLDRQRWARQNVGGGGRGSRWDAYAHALAGCGFVLAMALGTGALAWPDTLSLAALAARVPGADAPLPPERAGELQQLLDAAPAGAVVRLGPGAFRLDRPLVLRRDHVTLAGAGRDATRLTGGFMGQGEALLSIQGDAAPERCGRLSAAAARGDRRLGMDDPSVGPGDVLLLSAANDGAFLDGLGARRWREAKPELRRSLAEVDSVGAEAVVLRQPLGLDLPAGARACVLPARRNVVVRDLAVVYDAPGAADATEYANSRPEAAVDGIRVERAVDVRLERLAVYDAGRHPLHFDTALAPRVRDVLLDGARNKGAGGNGYLRIARTVRGRFDEVVVRGLRHVAFQWSSHDNVMTGLDSDTDVNFHGGFSHHNRVEAVQLAPRAGHPWPAVVRTPPDAAWAPPDGDGNVVALR